MSATVASTRATRLVFVDRAFGCSMSVERSRPSAMAISTSTSGDSGPRGRGGGLGVGLHCYVGRE